MLLRGDFARPGVQICFVPCYGWMGFCRWGFPAVFSLFLNFLLWLDFWLIILLWGRLDRVLRATSPTGKAWETGLRSDSSLESSSPSVAWTRYVPVWSLHVLWWEMWVLRWTSFPGYFCNFYGVVVLLWSVQFYFAEFVRVLDALSVHILNRDTWCKAVAEAGWKITCGRKPLDWTKRRILSHLILNFYYTQL
jgi:hypothetical protein